MSDILALLMPAIIALGVLSVIHGVGNGKAEPRAKGASGRRKRP